jgi:prepilin peptidase CpaA
MNNSAGIFLFIAWAAVVAISDYRARRISNSIVVAGLAAAFGCALFQCGPFGNSLFDSGIGAVVGLVVLLPFFALGIMGGADVKVFAVLGLWIAASLAAGAHSLWLVIAAYAGRARLGGAGRLTGATFELGGRVSTPYAACLVVAAAGYLVLKLSGGVVR